jgi:hypothetical protein
MKKNKEDGVAHLILMRALALADTAQAWSNDRQLNFGHWTGPLNDIDIHSLKREVRSNQIN